MGGMARNSSMRITRSWGDAGRPAWKTSMARFQGSGRVVSHLRVVETQGRRVSVIPTVAQGHGTTPSRADAWAE